MTRYIVNIKSGGARTQSIPLPNRLRVRNYVKSSPLGRWNTKISVFDKKKKVLLSGVKAKFMSDRW